MKAETRKEIQVMLAQLTKGKSAKKLREKFEKTGVLSKKEMKILQRLHQKNRYAAA